MNSKSQILSVFTFFGEKTKNYISKNETNWSEFLSKLASFETSISILNFKMDIEFDL